MCLKSRFPDSNASVEVFHDQLLKCPRMGRRKSFNEFNTVYVSACDSQNKREQLARLIHLKVDRIFHWFLLIERKTFSPIFSQSLSAHSGAKFYIKTKVNNYMKWPQKKRGIAASRRKCQAWKNRWNSLSCDVMQLRTVWTIDVHNLSEFKADLGSNALKLFVHLVVFVHRESFFGSTISF